MPFDPIYFDSAATTKPSPSVIEKVGQVMEDSWGNPSSRHLFGRKARAILNEARENVCSLIHGASPENIVFTSGGTEANNLALLGARNFYAAENFSADVPFNLLTDQLEHKSVLSAADFLEAERYSKVFYAPTRAGRVDPTQVSDIAHNHPISLASIMLVNNETGAINSVGQIARTLHEEQPHALIHTDCVQAAGYLSLDVQTLSIDLLSISSHKIHGPKGVGALYIRDPERFASALHGGSQEFGLRPGTENLANIAGFGVACVEAEEARIQNKQKIDELSGLMRNVLVKQIHGIQINRFGEPWCDKIISATFEGIDAETLAILLDNYGVCVSAGAACNSRDYVPSSALLASGLTEQQARSTIRLSPSEVLTAEQVLTAVDLIKKCVEQLRQIK